MQKVVEIEECGLALVVCVKVPEHVEFAHEPSEYGCSDIGREALVSVAAAAIDRFCRRAELLTARLGKSGLARRGLPFSFVLPRLKTWLAAVAAFGSKVAQKLDDDAPGNRSAERIVERQPEPREIGDAFGGC